jgi:Domain of Unknown Function (DUF1206)
MSTNANIKSHVREAQTTAKTAAISPTMTALARVGYAAKGVVYLVIGILAAQLAIGHGGAATDQRGALHAIYEQPFGKILLAIVAIGLILFAIWSFLQAFLDTERKGHDAKGVISRIGYGITGISYGLLGWGSLQLALGTGTGGKNSTASTQEWTAKLLQQPFGVPLVILIGLVVIGLACFMFYRAYSANFEKHFSYADLRGDVRKWAMVAGRMGHAALGVDFLIVGIFLVVAALSHNPKDAKGLDSALQTLLHQPFGPVLLAIVAIGLACYGVYSFVEARYRRVGKR